MKLHIVGSGCPQPVPEQYGSAFVLEMGEELFVVDCGPAATYKMVCMGLAPLRALFLALVHQADRYEKVVFCCGARTPEDLIYKNSILEKWDKLRENISIRVTVDKVPEGQEWSGNVGLVTTILDDLDLNIAESEAVVCGPPIMMKFVTFKLAEELEYPDSAIHLSMEKNMSCGFGKCGHCRLGPFFVCRDGPVLTFDKLKDLRGTWD